MRNRGSSWETEKPDPKRVMPSDHVPHMMSERQLTQASTHGHVPKHIGRQLGGF